MDLDLPTLSNGELLALYYIFNVAASNMPAPEAGSKWYRFFYQCIQTIAANWENFRTKGAKAGSQEAEEAQAVAAVKADVAAEKA